MVKLLTKLLAWLGMLAVVCGGVVSIAGAFLPWAHAVIFESIHLSLPGFVFILGGVCAGCGAAAVFLHRKPLITILLGASILFASLTASTQIPHIVRGELLQMQKGFFPVNELLDKFDLETVQVSNYGVKDTDYVGEGVQITEFGGLTIIIGALMSLPCDPLLLSGARRVIFERCRSCRAKWPLGREAFYCPKCAHATPRGFSHCIQCRKSMLPADRYCIHCGFERSSS